MQPLTFNICSRRTKPRACPNSPYIGARSEQFFTFVNPGQWWELVALADLLPLPPTTPSLQLKIHTELHHLKKQNSVGVLLTLDTRNVLQTNIHFIQCPTTLLSGRVHWHLYIYIS